jgi:hypothetical protein
MKVKVQYEIELPIDNATDEEIEEWLRFELHDNGEMSCKNPFDEFEPEPIFGTFDWQHC